MASGYFGSGYYASGYYGSGYYGETQPVIPPLIPELPIPDEIPGGGGGSMWGRDEAKRILDDDKVIMAVIKQFLIEVNLEL